MTMISATSSNKADKPEGSGNRLRLPVLDPWHHVPALDKRNSPGSIAIRRSWAA
jgi:hypothetical protein